MQAEQDQAEQENKSTKASAASGRQRQSTMQAFIKSAARAIGSLLGRQVIRGIMGSVFGGRR